MRAASLLSPILLSLVLISPAFAQSRVDLAVAETLEAVRGRVTASEAAKVEAAIRYARDAHRGQRRDGGELAIHHPMRVARELLASNARVSGNLLAATILHDVIEDTRRTRADIRATFGERIAVLVDAVSMPAVGPEGKEARDRAYYERFKTAPREAHVLKYFDRLNNIRDMRAWPLEGKLGYLQSTREKVVESLKARSPDLARALDAEVERLKTRFSRQLARDTLRLDPFRRADGTVRWSEALAHRARAEGKALGHFGLALFLKELAVVMTTGDRLRIEEFFDAVATTDFFVHYGLFAVGARGGEIAYSRYLQRVIKPQFLSGVLKTTVTLAAGLALPEIVNGTFSGKAFVVSLASLRLSITAVHAGLRSLSWAANRANLGRFKLSRLARTGNWAYAVAETAVVLLVAEHVERAVTQWQDSRKARGAVGEATEAFFQALRDGEDPATSAAAYRQAWDAYREFLNQPMLIEDARLNARLQRLARQAKLGADERTVAVDRVRAHPALLASVERRYGSLEAYAAARAREDDAGLTADMNEAVRVYEEAFAKHAAKVNAPDPDRRYLAALDVDSILGAADAPLITRWRTREALKDVSKTRPGSYADEARAFALARTLLDDPSPLDAVEAELKLQARLDANLLGLSGRVPE